ncbi:MAG: hypothetical protein A2087_06850 [Spirochaetes bacterium GWD1_61_31]|nr:MAG: hypothetical protein A2Y37_08620 [Spirochaetes bacterium GWB1_60_80]OHD31838.1 MAG: hypothetical protein A2004_09995 [Spirochaetes bacterium GWC1_61_12]OHD40067.1 MAG: hypothetical protein A2087_06850 [Spirochaetes bacterium GWD1_61_31]OHD45884.1 MAG: hypothetical protein A2Y35_04255 [Spirochaetes bacterium GWE1_60_18]OHD58428.1 MAG: hypothetical protein A2Y32_06645 [Spirochaetes bacterium GWF1_60_12]HAW85410.1 alpha/beta hydrolase [Spirochaetaceae bacterium]
MDREAVVELWQEVEGLRLHGWQAGPTKAGPKPAPVVFLLHGGGVDSAELSWCDTLPALAASHRVYAFDWPGYDQSQAAPGVSSLDLYSRLLVGLMDGLGVVQASLVGISMGGGAALLFALTHPKRVERLVLVGSYGLQRKAPWHFLSYCFVKWPALTRWSYAWARKRRSRTAWSLQTILKRPGSITERLVDQVSAAMRQPDVGLAFQSWQRHELQKSGLRTVLVDRVGELQMPVMIVHGGADSLVPLAAAREAKAINPAIRLEIMDGCGHWTQRDWPDEFNRLVRDFLGS